MADIEKILAGPVPDTRFPGLEDLPRFTVTLLHKKPWWEPLKKHGKLAEMERELSKLGKDFPRELLCLASLQHVLRWRSIYNLHRDGCRLDESTLKMLKENPDDIEALKIHLKRPCGSPEQETKNATALKWLMTKAGGSFPKTADGVTARLKELSDKVQAFYGHKKLKEEIAAEGIPAVFDELSGPEQDLFVNHHGLLKRLLALACQVGPEGSALYLLFGKINPRLVDLVAAHEPFKMSAMIKFEEKTPLTDLVRSMASERAFTDFLDELASEPGRWPTYKLVLSILMQKGTIQYPDNKTRWSKINMAKFFGGLLADDEMERYSSLTRLEKLLYRIKSIARAPRVTAPDGSFRLTVFSEIKEWVVKMGKNLMDKKDWNVTRVIQTLNNRLSEENYGVGAMARARKVASNQTVHACISWNTDSLNKRKDGKVDLDLHALVPEGEIMYSRRKLRQGCLDQDVRMPGSDPGTETISFFPDERGFTVEVSVVNYNGQGDKDVKCDYLVRVGDEEYTGTVYVPARRGAKVIIKRFTVPAASPKEVQRSTKEVAELSRKAPKFVARYGTMTGAINRAPPVPVPEDDADDAAGADEPPPPYEQAVRTGLQGLAMALSAIGAPGAGAPSGLVKIGRNTGLFGFVLTVNAPDAGVKFTRALVYQGHGQLPVPLEPHTRYTIACPPDQNWGVAQCGIGSEVAGYFTEWEPGKWMVVLIGARLPEESQEWKVRTLGLKSNDLPSRDHHLRRWWEEANNSIPAMPEGPAMIGLFLKPGAPVSFVEGGVRKSWTPPL